MGGLVRMLITRPDIWTNFTRGVPEYATDAFAAIDPWFYPLILFGIIGYIYTSMQSVTSAIIGILITLGLFTVTTSIFAAEGVPMMTQFLYIVTLIGLTMLILSLLLRRSRMV